MQNFRRDECGAMREVGHTYLASQISQINRKVLTPLVGFSRRLREEIPYRIITLQYSIQWAAPTLLGLPVLLFLWSLLSFFFDKIYFCLNYLCFSDELFPLRNLHPIM